MKIVLFTHTVVSDWNHGNAHFLRGLMRALQRRGHRVLACEARKPWSVEQLFEDHGHAPLLEFARRFPDLEVRTYGDSGTTAPAEEVAELTRGADLVLVHEFNRPELVAAVGEVRRQRGDFLLLFHDTHHRAVSAPDEIARLDLGHYDGVLTFGASLSRVYREELGHERVWTLHEAADLTVFMPLAAEQAHDVTWIGNWGDEERSAEIRSYLVDSARLLPELRFAMCGVRYPEAARREMAEAGISFGGWVPNHRVPELFARAKVTVHIPRGPYLSRLAGIPTIRPFEALACGIPLVSTPWPDVEGLFREGEDYLVARSPAEMRELMLRLCADPGERAALASSGRETILARHTCDHRAQELEAICAQALTAA
jgi:spore maturation protein CgeB